MESLDFLLSSYHFDLPQELIAQRRSPQSKLLVYNISSDEVHHEIFSNIHLYLPKESLLVFNRSKVFPARLKGQKASGGKAEFFVLKTKKEGDLYPVLIKTRSKKKISDTFYFPNNVVAKIEQVNDDGTFGVSFNIEDLLEYLNKYAHIPIPPYIRNGESDEEDKISYQTIYAKEEGSVAAPTAGLHFTSEVMDLLCKKGIDTAYVTLHVGAGTFYPVKTSNIQDHNMHSEDFFMDERNYLAIKQAREKNKKIFAVGTTSLRVLESSFYSDIVADQIYSTDIFIHPGKQIRSVDGLITNFHLPQSTLIMLVSSLIGREKTLELYNMAIKERYRFFSYGDAMLIIR